jgi:NADH:ubiquinone oxidoreductase subunit 6 (subunit J)
MFFNFDFKTFITVIVYIGLVHLIWQVLTRRFLIEKIFSLILVFVYLAYALLLAGLELLSLVILLLYVGAIAVLFLFVVMILNPDYHLLLEEQKEFEREVEEKIVKEDEKKDELSFFQFVLLTIGQLLFCFWVTVTFVLKPILGPSDKTFTLPDGTLEPYVYVVHHQKILAPWEIYKANMTLTELGDILYTVYGIGVFIIGACLLVAMISSILLCVQRTLKLKRQNISKQAKRYK